MIHIRHSVFCAQQFFSVISEDIGAVRKHMQRDKHKQAVASSSKSKTIANFFTTKDMSDESVVTASELSFIYH